VGKNVLKRDWEEIRNADPAGQGADGADLRGFFWKGTRIGRV